MTESIVKLPIERVEGVILIIRGEKVILDVDLARLYGVTTSRLNEQVRRNRERFPEDFMFQLTVEESAILRSQNAISKSRGGRRYPPYAFTEHGAIMAANVLNSRRAVQASVQVVRAFVRLRNLVSTHREIAAQLAKLESHLAQHDDEIKVIFEAIRRLTGPPIKNEKQIGFRSKSLKK